LFSLLRPNLLTKSAVAHGETISMCFAISWTASMTRSHLKAAALNGHYTFPVEPSVVQPEQRPCDAHPCGTNAECRQQGQAVSCICPKDYIGDPYSACRPECVLNDDCPREQSCVRGKCADPCPGTCGVNAECRVANHIPVCNCLTGHTGDPYGACRPIPVIRKLITSF
jgi:hypothetical protein